MKFFKNLFFLLGLVTLWPRPAYAATAAVPSPTGPTASADAIFTETRKLFKGGLTGFSFGTNAAEAIANVDKLAISLGVQQAKAKGPLGRFTQDVAFSNFVTKELPEWFKDYTSKTSLEPVFFLSRTAYLDPANFMRMKAALQGVVDLLVGQDGILVRLDAVSSTPSTHAADFQVIGGLAANFHGSAKNQQKGAAQYIEKVEKALNGAFSILDTNVTSIQAKLTVVRQKIDEVTTELGVAMHAGSIQKQPALDMSKVNKAALKMMTELKGKTSLVKADAKRLTAYLTPQNVETIVRMLNAIEESLIKFCKQLTGKAFVVDAFTQAINAFEKQSTASAGDAYHKQVLVLIADATDSFGGIIKSLTMVSGAGAVARIKKFATDANKIYQAAKDAKADKIAVAKVQEVVVAFSNLIIALDKKAELMPATGQPTSKTKPSLTEVMVTDIRVNLMNALNDIAALYVSFDSKQSLKDKIGDFKEVELALRSPKPVSVVVVPAPEETKSSIQMHDAGSGTTGDDDHDRAYGFLAEEDHYDDMGDTSTVTGSFGSNDTYYEDGDWDDDEDGWGATLAALYDDDGEYV